MNLGIWIHVEGDNTPNFDANGFVTSPDRTGTLISDLNRFLDVARDNNVFVIPVLWNGAVVRNQQYIDLMWDDAKLQSYIDNALIVSCNFWPRTHVFILNFPAYGHRLEGSPCFGILGDHQRT